MSKRSTKQATSRSVLPWQTTIVAVIGGAAAILAAVLPIVLSGSSGSGGGGSTPRIAIATMSSTPAGGGSLYAFTGTSTGVDTSSMLIFVMAQDPSLTADGGDWLVSPAATVTAGGRWHVSWDLPHVPAHVKWVAVVYLNSQGTCAPDEDCAEGGQSMSPCPPGSCPSLQSSAPSAPDDLSFLGPEASGDVARATFVAPTPSR